MRSEIWKQIQAELTDAARNPGHPFRYATLATIGLEQVPRLRTVVLRDFDPERFELTFYTDSRSKKMLHIKENNKVSLLMYRGDELLQLRLEGLAVREKDNTVLRDHWKRVEGASQKDYTTLCAPGTEIKSPDRVEYLEDEYHFSVVHIHPFKVEYLRLKRPNHIRVQFSKEKENWRSDFLVP